MHSIRFKITAITIAAILTTLLCVLLASYSTIQSENNRRSVEMMRLIGDDAKQSMEKYTEGIEQSVELIANFAADTLDSVMLAKGGVIGSSAKQSGQTPEQAAQLDAYLGGYSKAIQEVSSAVASHTHGIITHYYCINPEISTSEHGFFYSRVGRTGFVEQAPLDARELDPNDIEHTTWYYTPIERGRPSWVGPYTAHFLNEMWIYSYLVPIYKSGTLIGVLGMDIPVEAFVDQVKSIKVYDTGFACLLDADGHVLYHPELESGTVDLPIDKNLLAQDNSGDALIRYMANGEERQLSFTTLSNGMKLVIVAPTSEINSSTTHLIKVIVPIALVIIVIFTILTLLAMRVITNPLVKLTAASQRLADVDYDVELDYKGKDEVGALTNAFQRMRDQLKANIEDLNRKVQTDDLTGLPNQRYFFDLAIAERDRLLAEGKSPVMLYFNLLGMKHFNRQYGFSEGDQLIREVANVLARHFGELNMSHFGQDHFAVVSDEEHLDERLHEIFQECQTINGGKTLPVRAGIYQNNLEDVSVSVACDRAKFACDQHRGSYVSGFRRFDESMLKQIENIRYIINHLDQALEEHWVKVYYQPIVRAANGRVCDEEALSRWFDPERGVLPPADFIPALEDAGLIYKLDLYVLDQVLEKIKHQTEAGLVIVPHSINLSRSDFEACDIVEEIRKRVDAADINRGKITIEITESMIGSDFDFMKEQIERFQALGFPVWMDDFGNGYSSLDVLESIQFDLIKFDMSFTGKILDEGDEGRIILTEMMRMTTALGVDTICEGVETEEQSRFLQEIGCSKLQGHYYCKAIPLSEILERYETGAQIGYENPEESEYYEAIGRLNLYDLTVVASEDESSFQNIFNTLPMAIMEIKGDKTEFVRTNQSYRDFIDRYFRIDLAEEVSGYNSNPLGVGSSFMRLVHECCESGNRAFFDEVMPDGSTVHSFIRRVQTNPVTGATAVAIAVLSVTEPNEGATYASIARALALDYYNIYYVDLDTEQFLEYTSPAGGEDLATERHGEHFFDACERDATTRIYEDDREAFLASFTKENIIRELDERGVFTATYRLIDTGTPMYATMKVTRMEPEGHHIIMGISIMEQ